MTIAPTKEAEIGPILFELDCEAARQADKFEWVIEHGFNTNQPFEIEDDDFFGNDTITKKPSFFEPLQSYDYSEVAEAAVEANEAQLQSGFYLWRFYVTPAKVQ